MGLAKRIGRSEFLRGALCWLTAQYVRLVHATGRWDVTGDPTARRMWAEGRPFILAFWHGRILMMPKIWRREIPIHMLISQHRDGQLIARTVSHFGIHWLAGSSTRGGAGALRTMLKALKGSQYVGITPDGPRGPRMRASMGVITVARLSGCPVIPATFAAAGARILGSWDRFIIPRPFSRGVFVWGEPITVPPGAEGDEMEELRLKVEDELNRITAEADRLMNLGPVAPAPAGVEGGES